MVHVSSETSVRNRWDGEIKCAYGDPTLRSPIFGVTRLSFSTCLSGTSKVVQWLRVCLLVRRHRSSS